MYKRFVTSGKDLNWSNRGRKNSIENVFFAKKVNFWVLSC
jgi:hypothetical protein